MSGNDQELRGCFQSRAPATPSTCGLSDAVLRRMHKKGTKEWPKNAVSQPTAKAEELSPLAVANLMWTCFWGMSDFFTNKEVAMGASAGIAMGNRRGWDDPSTLTLRSMGASACCQERVPPQEQRRRLNAGRCADESCRQGKDERCHERHELPTLGR